MAFYNAQGSTTGAASYGAHPTHHQTHLAHHAHHHDPTSIMMVPPQATDPYSQMNHAHSSMVAHHQSQQQQHDPTQQYHHPHPHQYHNELNHAADLASHHPTAGDDLILSAEDDFDELFSLEQDYNNRTNTGGGSAGNDPMAQNYGQSSATISNHHHPHHHHAHHNENEWTHNHQMQSNQGASQQQAIPPPPPLQPQPSSRSQHAMGDGLEPKIADFHANGFILEEEGDDDDDEEEVEDEDDEEELEDEDDEEDNNTMKHGGNNMFSNSGISNTNHQSSGGGGRSYGLHGYGDRKAVANQLARALSAQGGNSSKSSMDSSSPATANASGPYSSSLRHKTRNHHQHQDLSSDSSSFQFAAQRASSQSSSHQSSSFHQVLRNQKAHGGFTLEEVDSEHSDAEDIKYIDIPSLDLPPLKTPSKRKDEGSEQPFIPKYQTVIGADGTPKYVCPRGCGQHFSKHYIADHVRQVHDKIALECPKCAQQFIARSTFKYHKKRCFGTAAIATETTNQKPSTITTSASRSSSSSFKTSSNRVDNKTKQSQQRSGTFSESRPNIKVAKASTAVSSNSESSSPSLARPPIKIKIDKNLMSAKITTGPSLPKEQETCRFQGNSKKSSTSRSTFARITPKRLTPDNNNGDSRKETVQCPRGCGQFYTRNYMSDHIRQFHDQIPLKCPYCPREFLCRSTYKLHKKKCDGTGRISNNSTMNKGFSHSKMTMNNSGMTTTARPGVGGGGKNLKAMEQHHRNDMNSFSPLSSDYNNRDNAQTIMSLRNPDMTIEEVNDEEDEDEDEEDEEPIDGEEVIDDEDDEEEEEHTIVFEPLKRPPTIQQQTSGASLKSRQSNNHTQVRREGNILRVDLPKTPMRLSKPENISYANNVTSQSSSSGANHQKNSLNVSNNNNPQSVSRPVGIRTPSATVERVKIQMASTPSSKKCVQSSNNNNHNSNKKGSSSGGGSRNQPQPGAKPGPGQKLCPRGCGRILSLSYIPDHIRSFHDKIPYECPKCGTHFRGRTWFKAHKKSCDGSRHSLITKSGRLTRGIVTLGAGALANLSGEKATNPGKSASSKSAVSFSNAAGAVQSNSKHKVKQEYAENSVFPDHMAWNFDDDEEPSSSSNQDFMPFDESDYVDNNEQDESNERQSGGYGNNKNGKRSFSTLKKGKIEAGEHEPEPGQNEIEMIEVAPDLFSY